MMSAHEVDAMAAIARADVDGFSVRGQRFGSDLMIGDTSRGRRRRGRDGLRRRRQRELQRRSAPYGDRLNGLRHVDKLWRDRIRRRGKHSKVMRDGVRRRQRIRLLCRRVWVPRCLGPLRDRVNRLRHVGKLWRDRTR